MFFYLTLLLFFFSPSTVLSQSDCKVVVGSNVSTIDGSGNYSSIQPGDKICLAAGNRGKLDIENLKGSSTSPITIVNYGGDVVINNSGFAGIEVTNSQYIRITGTGVSSICGAEYSESEQRCGIKIDSTQAGTAGRGIAGVTKTEYIEMDHIEIRNTGESGITVKTKDYTRDQFTQHQTKAHHNYIHDITLDEGAEGIYIGSSDYRLGVDPVLVGVDISYNLVARTGWDGIQIGSAIEDCNIHHNKIYSDSLSNVSSQESGIMNNPGSVCNIYNNLIQSGSAEYGIYVQGNGNNRIYNNVITDRLTNNGSGIKISTGSNTQNSIYVWNNTIVNVAEKGINFSNSIGSDNQLMNNLIVNAKITPLSAGIARSSNNLVYSNIADAKFFNSQAFDYSLAQGSPAIDSGVNVPVTFDYLNKVRPQGAKFDIGAYEYQSGGTGSTPLPTNLAEKTGDANHDGYVDENDYKIWFGNYLKNVSNKSYDGDFDSNGLVNGIDYILWLINFGK